MSSRLPIPESKESAISYKLLLRKERLRKPASVLLRRQILQKMQTNNYINEYDRIASELEGHAHRFNIPGGHWEKDKLTNRLQMLKKLFHDSHDDKKHPIMQK